MQSWGLAFLAESTVAEIHCVVGIQRRVLSWSCWWSATCALGIFLPGGGHLPAFEDKTCVNIAIAVLVWTCVSVFLG